MQGSMVDSDRETQLLKSDSRLSDRFSHSSQQDPQDKIRKQEERKMKQEMKAGAKGEAG